MSRDLFLGFASVKNKKIGKIGGFYLKIGKIGAKWKNRRKIGKIGKIGVAGQPVKRALKRVSFFFFLL